MRILVTGGLGFIGSAVVRHLLAERHDGDGPGGPGGGAHEVVNLDKGTYAATRGAVAAVADSPRYRELTVDLVDPVAVRAAVEEAAPDAVIHLAAESHVDRSIDGPGDFVATNVVGTYELLQACRADAGRRGVLDSFRLVHVSTDEVFGSLGLDDPPFDDTTRYDPRSPYSASKAASDHLVRAWHETFGLATLVTNCSNNYGAFQFPEKLIPLMILKAVAGRPLPVYGRGENIRDWLLVDDHAAGIVAALIHGEPGRTYLFGGDSERTNLEVVEAICDLVDGQHDVPPLPDGAPRRSLIEFVADRPGHDLRYAVDATGARRELGWAPSVGFEEGLARTVRWYLDNRWWWQPLVERSYDGSRLGVSI